MKARSAVGATVNKSKRTKKVPQEVGLVLDLSTLLSRTAI